MTKGDLEGMLNWGRPVKPLAGIMSLLMLSLIIFNIRNNGVFGNLWLGDVIVVLASMSMFSLWYGWFGRSQKMAEIGLFLASIVYFTRAIFVFFLIGPDHEVFWQSFLLSLLAAFAFYLEARDSTFKTRSAA